MERETKPKAEYEREHAMATVTNQPMTIQSLSVTNRPLFLFGFKTKN